MAPKRGKSLSPTLKAVTDERAARLYRMLQLLASGPQNRSALIRRLRLDVRGFYRDLELLRAVGIDLPLIGGRYTLEEDVHTAAASLPFPDPHLTLGEAAQLAKGRSAIHRKLRSQIKKITR